MTACRVACLQLSPGEDLSANIEAATRLGRAAAEQGARFILTPEYVTLLHASGRVMRETAREEASHPALASFREMAARTGCWVLVGSLTVTTEEERIANRSYLIDAAGEIASRYDKIHMFDATLPNGRTLRESSTYRPGDRAVVCATPWGRLGLSICYDLRFPQLYRALATAGADFLAVPSAFTASTGPLHWHALLRARAIENTAWVIAPATCGTHPGGHATYGHSLVVDPRGTVIADGGEAPGIVMAEVDARASRLARQSIPSVDQTRAFEAPKARD